MGINYHWIPELYQRLGLPLYDGIRKSLFLFGQHRDRVLNKSKEKESKRKGSAGRYRGNWTVSRGRSGLASMVMTHMASYQTKATKSAGVAQVSTQG